MEHNKQGTNLEGGWLSLSLDLNLVGEDVVGGREVCCFIQASTGPQSPSRHGATLQDLGELRLVGEVQEIRDLSGKKPGIHNVYVERAVRRWSLGPGQGSKVSHRRTLGAPLGQIIPEQTPQRQQRNRQQQHHMAPWRQKEEPPPPASAFYWQSLTSLCEGETHMMAEPALKGELGADMLRNWSFCLCH